MALLDAFGPEQSDFSLGELASRAELPKSTAHRILGALEQWGGVERSASGRYRVGLKLFELGGLVYGRMRIRELALPYMEDMLTTTHETIHLATLRGAQVVYLERLTSHRSIPIPSRVAGRFPASCSGVGKAILAFSPREVVIDVMRQGLPALTPYSITSPVIFLEVLEQIRRSGVAYDREEASIGLMCVAAPVLNHAGEAIAAISVSGPVHRIKPEALVPVIRASTLAISRRLGYRPPAPRNGNGNGQVAEAGGAMGPPVP